MANSLPTEPGILATETCQAASLDGLDDLIDVPDYAGLSLGTTFTVEAWVYWNGTDTNRYQALAGQTSGNASGTHEWFFGLASSISTACGGGGYPTGALVWDMFGGGACSHSNSAVPIGAWTHVAAVYNGGQVTFYIDGVEDTTVTRSSVRSQTGSENLALGWQS